MVYSVEEIVQALDEADRITADLSNEEEWRRQRAQKWIELGEEREARGQDDLAKRAYFRAFSFQPPLSMNFSYDQSTGEYPHSEEPLKPIPLVTELRTNWQEYGFVDPREPSHYQVWIILKSMRERHEGKPENELGYRGLKSPDGVLQRYPLNQFREDFLECRSQS